MTAHLIGQITVKDQDLWQEYVAGVQESIAPYRARILFRGRLKATLAGHHPHQLVVAIEFSDHATLLEWFHSESYQALVPLRDRAADVIITTYVT